MTRPLDPATLLKKDTALYTHLRSSVFWYPDHAELEFKNLTSHPISIEAVYFKDKPEKNLWHSNQTLPIYNNKNNEHIHTQSLNVSEFSFNDKLMVRYKYRSSIFNKPVFLQFRDSDTGFLDHYGQRKG